MKILVLGASGMAGHVVAKYLEEQGYNIDTLANRRKLSPKTKLIDVTDLASLYDTLRAGQYDVVVNCIGILVRESIERQDKAVYLNAYLPKALETYCRNSKTRIIHISSDGVFSGMQKEYTESSLYDGQSMYSRSKALGEIRNTKDLTLRTSIIGPELSPKHSSLFGWFYDQKSEVSGFTNIEWLGVTTLQLAKAIEAAIGQNVTGIYHLVPNEAISKFDLLTLFKQALNRDALLISPAKGTGTNAVLLNTRTDFLYDIPGYSEMVSEMLEWIQNHKDLYPHYSL